MIKKAGNIGVSAIVPVYNQERCLRKCLESIREQTLCDMEVIVIDDASTDGSEQIIDEFCSEDARFKKISFSVNRGAGAARNEGMRCAKGEYIVFLDSDDWFHKDMLQKAFSLAKEQELDVCLWNAYEYDEVKDQLIEDTPHFRKELFPGEKIFSGAECRYLFNMTSGAAWNKMYSRRFLGENNICFLSTDAFNDMYMTYTALLSATKISAINERYTYYRVNNKDSIQGRRKEHLNDLFTSVRMLHDHIKERYPSDCEIMRSFKNYLVSCIYSLLIQSDTAEEDEELIDFVLNDKIFRTVEYYNVYHFYQSNWLFLKDAISERNGDDGIKISVIVPTYNDESTIVRCLDSLVSQRLKGLEFVIVDDCSADGTFNIINEYARSDSRFIIMRHDENQSAFMARKDGVLAARGKYIMFADADDYLSENACELLWERELEEHADILHFGTNVIIEGEEDVKRIEGYKKLINPPKVKLYDSEVFDSFIERSFEGHLWNKIFYRELAVYALKQSEDRVLPKGQDKYYYWIMAFNAKSYRGYPEYVLYNYCYGIGVEGKKEYGLGEFELFCKQAWTEEAVNIFMRANGADERYADAMEGSRRNLLRHTVRQIDRLNIEDRPAGIRLLIKYWNERNDRSEIVDAFQDIYRGRREELISLFNDVDIRPCRKIKTIGTYYHIFSNGGIQRVLAQLMQIWVNAGYNVVFFTDYTEDDDYQLPDGVTRVTLAMNGNSGSCHYRERGRSFEEYCELYGIDVMVYHEYFGQSMLWDMLLFKMMDIPFVVYYHNVFSKFMATYEEQFFTIPEVAKLADAVAVLSQIDKTFWKNYNGNAFEVKNPLVFDLDQVQQNSLDSKIIVWVGRLDELHKRFMEPIDIIKEVLPIIPDAKLVIVGRDRDSTNYNRLKSRIEKLHLEDTVILCGYQKDVAPFYKMASVYLMTSTFEGYPMTLVEALSFGLPVVMYDLPYLTLLQDNDGVSVVNQGDRKSMASEVVRLLSDKEYRVFRGAEARRALERLYSDGDIASEWDEIFRVLEKDHSVKPEKNVMVETVVEHFKVSFNNNAREFRHFDRKIKGLESEIENVRNSKKDEVRKIEQRYKDRIAELEKKASGNSAGKNDRRDNDETGKLLAREQKKTAEYEFMLQEIRRSFTYKVGRMVTFLPRWGRHVLFKKPM